MYITGTHFNYLMICKRKLWLFANNIQMEHTSDLVSEGNLIHESSYSQRSNKFQEVAIDGIKVDYYDKKQNVIHEIKKSDKREEAHLLQLKYYIYVFEQNGIVGTKGILEYPAMRKTEEVFLTSVDRQLIEEYIELIQTIISSDKCPDRLPRTKCRNCSYFDFCYAGEDETH